jgi:steroid 5-alpha reductase family enzyme
MRSAKCEEKISDFFSVTINGILHILILFTFLTILFFTLVASLEKSSFENEMTKEINNSVKSMSSNLSAEDKEQVSKFVNQPVNENGQTTLDIGIDRYSKPSDFIIEHNKWVKITAISVILVVLLCILIIIFVLSYSCNKCTGITSIIKENVVTFMFVGLVEYLFFTQIAFKYVPTPPSTMITSLIDSFKKTFV